MRAFTLWQTDFQRRVRLRQVPQLSHSDMPSAGESMYFLTSQLPTACAALTVPTILSFGYALRRSAGRLGTNYASMRHLTNQFPAPRAALTASTVLPFGCGTACASICFLANQLSAPRAGLASFAALSFGYFGYKKTAANAAVFSLGNSRLLI